MPPDSVDVLGIFPSQPQALGVQLLPPALEQESLLSAWFLSVEACGPMRQVQQPETMSSAACLG